MTPEEFKAEMAEWREKFAAATPYVKSRKWEYILIASLVLCALFAFWRWQTNAAEADRLQSIVNVNADLATAQKNLDALEARAKEREAQIEKAVEESRKLDALLAGKRAELRKATAAKVQGIPKDAAGVAKALTDAGFPASAVVK